MYASLGDTLVHKLSVSQHVLTAQVLVELTFLGHLAREECFSYFDVRLSATSIGIPLQPPFKRERLER